MKLTRNTPDIFIISSWMGFFLLSVLLFYGFASTPNIFSQAQFRPYHSLNFLKFVVSFFVVAFLFLVCNYRRFHVLLFLSSLIVIVAAVGSGALFAVMYFLFSSLLLGDLLAGNNLTDEINLSDAVLLICLGTAIYMTLISILVHFKVNYPITYTALLAIPLAANTKGLPKYSKMVKKMLGPIDWKSDRLYLIFGLLIFILSLHLMNALLPEIGHDALSMHLSVPSFIFAKHYWNFDFKSHVWALMPMGGDFVYTAVYMVGGESATRLMNFSFLVLTSLLLFSEVRKWLSMNLALLAMAMYVSTPLIALETRSLFVENVWVAFLFAAVISLNKFGETSQKRYFYSAALLCGAALSTKVGTLGALPAMGVLVFCKLKRGDGILKSLFAGTALLLAVGLLPYVYAFLVTGNPVFPFMNSFFKSVYYETEVSFRNPFFNQQLSASTLFDTTFHSHKYLESGDGVFGYQYFVLLPIGLMAVHRKSPPLVWVSFIVSATYFLLTMKDNGYLRYVCPAMPLFMVLIAAMIARVRTASKRLAYTIISVGVIITVLNIYFMPASGYWSWDFSPSKIFDFKGRGEYVETFAPERKCADYLNLRYGDMARVGFFSRPFIAGLAGYGVTYSWHSYDFFNRVKSARKMDDVAEVFKEYRLTHLVLYKDVAVSSPRKKLLPQVVTDFLKSHTRMEFETGDVFVAKVEEDLLYSR